MLRDLGFLFHSKRYHYEPKKNVSAFNEDYIQYEITGDKGKSLSIKEYLDMIRLYLSGTKNDHKTQGEWKIYLTRPIKFISFKNSDETRIMHSKSHNIEIMIGNKIDEHIEEFLNLFYKDIKKD